MKDLATITRETRRVLSNAFGSVTLAKESNIHAKLTMMTEFSEVEIIEVGMHNVVVFENHEISLMPIKDVESVSITIGEGSKLSVNLETGLWENPNTAKPCPSINQ